MIDEVLKFILMIFVIFIIFTPIPLGLFKAYLFKRVQEEIIKQEKYNRLKRDMKQRKKGSQGKIILK